MDPITTGALIMGGGSLLSSAMNVGSAERQMKFQREMAGSKHQREVADLRKAGLNPILSATKGMGSGAPSGAMAHVENPAASAGDLMAKKGQLDQTKISTAAQAGLANQGVLTSRSQVQLNSANATKALSETIKNGKTLDLIEQQVQTGKAQTGHYKSSARSLDEEAKKRKFYGDAYESMSNILNPQETVKKIKSGLHKSKVKAKKRYEKHWKKKITGKEKTNKLRRIREFNKRNKK